MPVDNHLSQIEMTDFRGGLWTVNRAFMPANAAQTMEDCYPIPSGGLRAFRKPTAITTSGLVAPTTETCFGLFIRSNVVNRSGSGVSDDRYMATYNSADTKMRVYRMDQTNSAVVWSVIWTSIAGSVPGSKIKFTLFAHNDGNTYVVFAIPQGVSADNGTYSVRYSDAAVTKLTAKSGVWNHQDRLLVTSQITAPDGGSRIYFSDPGAFTNIDANYVTTDQSVGISRISGLAAFSPGDLLVFKEGAPIYLVQGDLTNYTLRAMSNWINGGGVTASGPEGPIVFTRDDGFHTTPDGNVIIPLSPQIAQSYWDSSAASAIIDNYFYAQGKLWLDYETKSWFSSSFLSDSAAVSCSERRDGTIWVATAGTSFTLYRYLVEPSSTSNRAESYTFKSAPMRDPAARQIEIRQVEVYAQCFNGATSTVAVTVNGVTRSKACDAAGRGQMTFYFMARAEELDVQVVAASNASGVEAPLIEAIRVGTQPGHFLGLA